MAAPNLVNVTSIVGKTAVTNLTTTAATLILSNAAASNMLMKVNTLIVSNVDPTATVDVTVTYYSAAALGGTGTQIVDTIAIPADTSLIVVDKNTAIYLEEDRSIGATAAVANDVKIICSYEQIS
jgi:hypothetical protein